MPKTNQQIRYAVVGLGYISQVAVLPAFAHAGKNTVLTALVSDDHVKRQRLSRKYKVKNTYSYAEYDDCLHSGEIDAVYIALPNSMHHEYATRAAKAGIHVLCEKPMGVTTEECEEMSAVAKNHHVKLMVAYRLHFEEANLKAIQIIRSGRLGEPRYFQSSFSMQVKEGNSRVHAELGGGPLMDIGIYCINAARYLFGDEPIEVLAYSANNGEKRFQEVDEAVSAVMRFPHERLATFTASFGATDVSFYELVGTKGKLRVEHAYEYAEEIKHHLTVNGKTTVKTFKKRDQFGPELLYFSDCILRNQEPEPSGREGLADLRVIEAISESTRTGQSILLTRFSKQVRPGLEQEITLPPVREPALLHAQTPFH